MRARRSAPSARLSLIENQVHTLPNDNRQLAKNEPLERKISPCPKHDKTSRHPPAVRSGFFAVPLLESSRARFVRRPAERRNAKEADDDAACEGGGAAPETPGLHFFQIRPKSGFWPEFRGPAPKNSSAGGWGDSSLSTEGPPSRLRRRFEKLWN